MSAAAVPPILVCYDRSAGAHHAVETAGALFPGRPAIVLHVWSPASAMAFAYGGAVSLPSYDDDALREAARKLADDGARIATAAGLAAVSEICEVTGDGAVQTILDVAERHDAALIVLGARGLSRFRSMLLGSVSNGVAQHARRPVLIVRPAGEDASAGGPEGGAASTGA
jgi:nucleotide-binding universal stress UspA family protein